MGEIDNRRDTLEAFVHMFIAEPELERRFMKMIDEYAQSFHLKESKLLIERMKNVELFKDEFQIEINDETNSLDIKQV